MVSAIAAVSINMQSLDAAILPTGYFFAMINQHGKVLYHSQKSKNLNENILNEISARDDLTGCIQAKTKGIFDTKYFIVYY